MQKRDDPTAKPQNSTGFLCACVIVAAIFSAIHTAALLFQSDTVIDLPLNRPLESTYIESVNGWVFSPSGLAAAPHEADGAKPEFIVGVAKSSYEDLFLDVIPTHAGRGKIQVALLDDGFFDQKHTPASETASVDRPWYLKLRGPFGDNDVSADVTPGEPVNVSGLLPGNSDVLIVIEPIDGATGPLLHGLRIRRSVWSWSCLLVPFYWMMIVSAAICLLISTTRIAYRRTITVAGLIMVGVACFAPVDVLRFGGAVAAVVAAFAFVSLMKQRNVALCTTIVLTVCMFVAADARLQALNIARFHPLDPDAATFRSIAATTSWFYDSGFREPLFILFVKIFTSVISDGDMAVRLVSMLISLSLVPLIWWVGRELCGSTAGLLAAALIATSPDWASQAVRGLRLEAFTAGLLILTAAIFSTRQISVRRLSLWMGAAAAAVCLIRMTSMWLCIIGIAWGFRRRSWDTRACLLTIAVVIGVQAPFYVQCYRTFGDPWFACNQHIRFYRNQEFRDQPGFPTSEQIEEDAYAGPPVTATEFFFRQHSLMELGKRTAIQFHSIFLGDLLRGLICGDHGFLYGWALVSMALVAFSGQRMLIPWMLLLIGPVVWLYSEVSQPEWRLIFHISAFIYLCMGMAAVQLFRATLGASPATCGSD